MTIELLLADIEILKTYLQLKFRQGDWHGVSDAANDIRDLVAKVELLKEQTE